MYIADPESPGSFGREDYQFSIFGNPEWIFPPMELNSILRIHHMIAEEYDNNPTCHRNIFLIRGLQTAFVLHSEVKYLMLNS